MRYLLVAIMTASLLYAVPAVAEDAEVEAGMMFEEDATDPWTNTTEESEWDGGTGEGEPEDDAIIGAGGDGSGDYD